MIKIVKLLKYTIPLFGNKRSSPYGKMIISDGLNEKIVNFDDHKGFTFKRKRYYLENKGSLYNPKYKIKEE